MNNTKLVLSYSRCSYALAGQGATSPHPCTGDLNLGLGECFCTCLGACRETKTEALTVSQHWGQHSFWRACSVYIVLVC